MEGGKEGGEREGRDGGKAEGCRERAMLISFVA